MWRTLIFCGFTSIWLISSIILQNFLSNLASAFSLMQAAGFKWIGDRDEPADQDFLPSLLQKYIREDSTISNKLIDISGSINQTNDVHESISQEPISNKTLPPFPRVAQHEFLNSQERDSAISRYKEKRKTRR